MTEKTALVTGGARRIGRAIVNHLAQTGWHVAIHCNTSKSKGRELVKELESMFPVRNFRVFTADLGKEAEATSLVEDVVSEMGALDMLVNNASVFDPGIIRKTTPELFDQQMNINLKAPFFLTRDFANRCRKGVIVNLLDTRIRSNSNTHAAYSLSKKAFADFTLMAALELGPHIRVNGIAPGATLPPKGQGKEYLVEIASRTPMGVLGGVKPILQSLDYILENQNLTGQILYCDGGRQLL
ncbi:MAG: SDR family NAD(P)-dependent oxidoreductase [Marinifilaceae bacterium]